jgi:hypothetical protein
MAPSVAGTVLCPSLLEPQQAAESSLRITQTLLVPALIWLTVAVSGVLCVEELSPQQTVLLSLRTEQVWKRPVLMALRVPSPDGGEPSP